MRTLVRIGVAMAALAAVLVVASFGVLRAEISSGNWKNDAPGSHVLKTETRKIDATAVIIDSNGPVDLVIKQGATPSMTVSAEERLLPRIKTEQAGNTLTIDFREIAFHSNHPMRVEITLPTLQQLSMHGSGDGQVNGFSGDKIVLSLRGSGDVNFDGQYQHVTASVIGSGDLGLGIGKGSDADLSLLGSGSITANGQSKNLTVRMLGSGDLDASRLQADDLKIDVMGSGDSSVYAKQSVAINLHGSGDVDVHGKPAQRNINRLGSGDISWDGE